jgi:DNA repair protein RecN (Recombination protein N)
MRMLLQLAVQNLVLIEALTLELGPGFNVITGETGAGKSMLVDALGLVIGGRASADVVRRGAREAEVEALFDLPPGSRVAVKLEAAGIPCERELVLRRVVQAEGRSRAFANGRMCTVAQLTDLAGDLCDIASQHESVALTDPATHMDSLDAFGGLQVTKLELGAEVDRLSDLGRQLEALRQADRGRAEREDYLAFQLRELDELDPRLGEEIELESERARLRHAGKLGEATRGAAERLYEGEDALCDALGRTLAELESAQALDPSLGPLVRAVEGARAELVDAARGLSRYADSVEANPERLAAVEDRLFQITKLLRKHGPTTVELVAHRAALAKELEELAHAERLIPELQAAYEARLADVSKRAQALSKKRRAAAERLADAIGKELSRLAMGRAKVVVDVTQAPSGDAAMAVEGVRLTRTGIDRVEFLIAPNPGEEPRPLRRIASGGELSRALLALKRVLAENGPAGLYVFDEVDAGVGGAVAEVIGHAIRDVASHRQVVCITHLAQIAALADTHFVVGKAEKDDRTFATVRRLDAKQRVDELARMIGGVKVGAAAKRAAEELMAGGASVKK